MSKLSKKVKKVAKAVINPVGAGIEKVTGMSQKDQLLAGAGIGGVAAMFGGPKGTVGGAQDGQYVETGLGSGNVMPISRPSGGVKAGGLASWAPSLLGLAGDVYSARQLSTGQESANQASLASAREQMQFQERMSSTAHQREVEDLKLAGLNPVLSANAGASSPSGESVEFKNEAPDYRGSIHSAFEARRIAADTKESMSRTQVNMGQLYTMAAQQENALASADNLKQTKRKSAATADMMD